MSKWIASLVGEPLDTFENAKRYKLIRV